MKRRILIIVSFVLLIAGLAIISKQHVSMDSMVRNERWLRDLIQSHPFSAWFMGFGVYFLVSLVPGTSGKSVICGWLYGFWQAVLMVDVALTGAGLIMFFVSRYALRDAIRSRFRTSVERLEKHLDRSGPFYLLLLRMAHAPFTVVNYASGALPISTRNFWWTTQIGLLPGTCLFVFAGTQLPTLRDLQDQGAMRLIDPWLIGALVATAGFPIGARWVFSRWRLTSESQPRPGGML
jgi:uncharacterized membrane protein YdjX (TVP38/TMEM64 family)